MEYRRVGRWGVQVSALSLGAWLTYGSDAVSEDRAIACVRHAVEVGINYIDVADAYARGQAEVVVGRAIEGMKRSDLVIATKAFWPMSDNVNDKGLSRKHITESVNASLKRLNTEYVDIFFCHRADPETPVDETLRAIDDLIRQGKILYWGTSMWTADNLDEAFTALQTINANPPIVEQPIYNMLDRDTVEGALEESVARHGMGLVVWSPLAQGVLTGKYNDGVPDDSRANQVDKDWFSKQISEDRLEKSRALANLAREFGTTQAALALAWTLRHPSVSSAITGASRPEQIDENLKALDVQIDDAMNALIEEVLGARMVGV